MANPFDQFDTQATAQANPFDQFDSNPGAAHASTGANPFDQFDQHSALAQSQAARNQGGLAGAANALGGMWASFKQGGVNSIAAEPIRAAMEGLDYGGYNEKMRQLYPHASDDEIKAKVHDLYNQALINARQSTAQDVANHSYAGQTVGNFVAGAAGDPTTAASFLVPSLGIESKLGLAGTKGITAAAARIGLQGTKMAGINAASNAASQVMDQAEGVQKNFDIMENLKAAQSGYNLGAGFGAAGELLPVVSPFVAGLFGQRGVDTTPSAVPRELTTPTTNGPVKFTPEQASQFKQVLKTGDVDQIKGFMQGMNGQKPSWSDVDNLVQMRDNMSQQPPGYTGQEAFNQAADEHMSNLKQQVVNDHVSGMADGWKNGNQIEVVPDPSKIADPTIRQQVMDKDDGQAVGIYGSDGITRIFSDRVDNPAEANAVLFHESLGHAGLDNQFGSKLDQTMGNLYARNVGSLKGEVDEYIKQNPGTSIPLATEEVLAGKSEQGPLKSSWSQALVADMRSYGRKMGLKLNYNDSDVAHILAMAHDSVINGNGRNVRANNFSTGRSAFAGDSDNKYMFTGSSAKGFREDSPTAFTANDGRVRNEISDRDAKYRDLGLGEHKLGDVLDHPALYREYPQLRNTPVEVTHLEGSDGTYDPETGRIQVDASHPDPRSVVLHETQHAIQDIEKYPGHDADTLHMSDEDYRNNALEKEAFETEARKDMGPLSRMAEEPNKFMRKQPPRPEDRDFEAMQHYLTSADKAHQEQVERTWQQTQQSARDWGINPSDIRKLGKTPDLSKRVAQLDLATQKTIDRMSDVFDRWGTPDQTLADQNKALQAIADLRAVTAARTGAVAEAARALNISKLGYTKAYRDAFAEMLKEKGDPMAGLVEDPEQLNKFMAKLNLLRKNGNNVGFGQAVNSLNKPNWEDYLISLHNDMLLASLSSHVKATRDMTIGIGRDLMQSVGALGHTAIVNSLKQVGMKGLAEPMHPAEVAGRFWGITKAAMDANTYMQPLQYFKGNAPVPSFGGKAPAQIPVLNKITQLISVQDQFFRAFATNMHLYGLAARDAVKEMRANGQPLKWDDIMSNMSNKALNPTSEMMGAAKQAADETLLLNHNPLTEFVDRQKATTPNSSGYRRAVAFLANYTMPFLRVESNSLYNRVVRQSPLAIFDPATLKDLKTGGADAGRAYARIIMGTASVMAAWQAAKNGILSAEGPDNANKKKELEAGGWRPNSVSENGTYNTGNKLAISLNPLDIHNSLATDVAAAYEASKKGGDAGTVIKSVLLSTMKSLADSSWANDLAPVLDAVQNPQKAQRFVGEQVASMIPRGVAQFAAQGQPQVDTQSGAFSGSIANQVKADIPGLRQTLPTHYSVYGDPLESGQTVQSQRISSGLPGNHTDATTDPTEKELQRLTGLIKSPLITPVSRSFKVDGQTKTLDDFDYEEYQHYAGRAIVESTRQMMSTPDWQNMSDQDKVLWVKDNAKDMKHAVKEQMYGH